MKKLLFLLTSIIVLSSCMTNETIDTKTTKIPHPSTLYKITIKVIIDNATADTSELIIRIVNNNVYLEGVPFKYDFVKIDSDINYLYLTTKYGLEIETVELGKV